MFEAVLCLCSRNIQVDSPYDISRAADELHYTYLDTFGRPVIVAYKKNLVEQHIQDIVVSGCAVCCWSCRKQWLWPMDLSWSFLTPSSRLLQVHYTFNKVLMLQEPLLVVAAFYILFFTVIVYVRLDFSITKVLCSLLSVSDSPCALVMCHTHLHSELD